ncbi:PadR family transcriptional regulator [Nocardia cyriacigeorgica]|uniref:PadR family transcriptional regulator n=1 Tax=Nocardia cyriacigeorgica TaxID=135487 RepID=UPI00189574FD|nr:PadR family transcriptional regulator [Nocardia cyriacigeorgica]MBF6457007.1 PadR family transcriptional regulator [Nocardia cyriacigeorgica]MBF6478963.1 PadR family transcriptional regulator [Nocardia cyriacigeorgica]MBF6554332.1 PadR family transcriptional regulator [Nocardia cyriacigeorgica]
MADLGAQDHIVLGLIARHGPLTPYDLKARIEESVDYFWPIPHAQLYRIPVRLAEQGLLREEAEEGGRRRRVFHLTGKGRERLREWLADPATPPAETRDPAQLKLFFVDLGDPDDVVGLARNQSAEHRRWLDHYRKLYDAIDHTGGDVRAVARARILQLGIGHEQAYVDFWEELAADPEGPATRNSK